MFQLGDKVRVKEPGLVTLFGNEGVITRLFDNELEHSAYVTFPFATCYVRLGYLERVGIPNEKYFLLVKMKGGEDAFQECRDEDHAKELRSRVLASPVVDTAFIVRGEVVA